MNLATKKMAKSSFDLSTTQLDLNPYNEHYGTPGFTGEFARERGAAAGKQAAPYKPPLEPPVGADVRWLQHASIWIEYAMHPENGVVRELITRRAQYLSNMSNPKKTMKNKVDALKSFNDVNMQLRDKFLLPPRDPLIFCDALKNNDDVADFLRANNLMK